MPASPNNAPQSIPAMISTADVLAYVIALGVAAAIPGPGMTALVARSVSSGAKQGFAMLSGFVMGDIIFLSFAVFGLGVIANTFNTVFVFIRWGSIAYLLYLAWQFWHADHHDMNAKAEGKGQLGAAALSGLAITLGNPKAIAFYLALLPLVLDLNTISISSWATVLVPATVMVLLVVGSAFILGALSIRRKLSSATAQQKLHRFAAIAMAGAAGTMILKEL